MYICMCIYIYILFVYLFIVILLLLNINSLIHSFIYSFIHSFIKKQQKTTSVCVREFVCAVPECVLLFPDRLRRAPVADQLPGPRQSYCAPEDHG